ncbi:MAG: universal stress protein [Rudaea sp.]|uniref:universal stress protein n=1 Tax=Rudaea sp. TaxID=2136325 RepID=UPI0039E5DFE8
MARFDILVHIRRYEGDSLAAGVAFALARRLDAYVSGLYVASLGTVAYSTLETVVFQVQEADEIYHSALAQGESWTQRIGAAGVKGEWLVAQGEPVEAICHAARWHDLVVAERPQLNADAPVGWGLVSRTVFGAGVPVVVVPETTKTADAGERVVIAWNHSREAARAIHGALPLLRQAKEVLVLDGVEQTSLVGARHLPALDLAACFARHGVKAQFRPFEATGNYGAGILEAAHAATADLIVMGAWGHSRIAELVLGGATRHLFQHSDVPLFVAH